MRLEDNLTVIKGIGEKTASLFAKIGVVTVEDLLQHYPRAYEEHNAPSPIASLKEEGQVTVCGILTKDASVRRVKNLQIAETIIRDESGSLKVTWFNMPYLKNTLTAGHRYVFRGKLEVNRYGRTLQQPVIYTVENYASLTGRLSPVYNLTAGLKNHTVAQAVERALDDIPVIREYMPEWIRRKYSLAEYNYAVRTIHFPPDQTELSVARHRLVFDEFFLFILSLRYLKDTNDQAQNTCRINPAPSVDDFIRSLPFTLTKAQLRCYHEILEDLTGPRQMNRLIQGDVGSGKTIVAVLALLQMTENGWQGALMAPTEVLARQHYETVTGFLKEGGIDCRVELLTGSMSAREKREAYARIASGEADIVIGTHAVIQEKVHFARLGLVITDEQHRFGVRQREALARKGQQSGQISPHVLVMSATPIPRTLAIILYGDLDISVLDEKPADRLPIRNAVIRPSQRRQAYEFITRQVEQGRQAYIICPMVEESDALEGENVLDYAKKLREQLPAAITIGTLHGRMKASEKDAVMEDFAAGRIQVLVSTTVVEVGVDVPNATVMLIENAERFGLAQLHQLRGRIGRGEYQSYCMFLNGSDEEKSKRLEILSRTNDGFEIASEDLKLRGPGDLFGDRQSGLMNFALGDIFTDANILREADEAADLLLSRDYRLEEEENLRLREKLIRLKDTGTEKTSL